MNERAIHVFSCPDVADLAWMLESSPLLGPRAWKGVQGVDEEWCGNQFSLIAAWLRELDTQPAALLHEMSLASSLLGKRFETLVSFWLNHSGQFEVAGERLVFSRSGRTSGEVDFVFRELGTEDWIHLEVACKYYLGSRSSSDWSAWRGANAADRLDLKVHKMEDQLRLLESPMGREWLRENEVRSLRRMALLKGYFFVPFNQLGKCALPRHASRHHPTGWWMHLSDAQVLIESPGPWIILPRSRWFAPWNASFFNATILTGKELMENVNDQMRMHKSVMIVQADPLGGGFEISRGMIVPDQWPEA